MENKIGLYRMLIDASCAISQNLSALSPNLGDEAIKTARNILREIASCAEVLHFESFLALISPSEKQYS